MALVQTRLDLAGSAPPIDDVEMVRTRSQTAGNPRASLPPTPRHRRLEPRPRTPSDGDMNYNVDCSIVVNLTGESGDVKTYLPSHDFDNLDTTGREKVALRTIALCHWSQTIMASSFVRLSYPSFPYIPI